MKMKFEEALAALRQGKKIRLIDWDLGAYIYAKFVNNNLFGIYDEDNDNFNHINLRSAFAYEWEIYEEPKTEEQKNKELIIELAKKVKFTLTQIYLFRPILYIQKELDELEEWINKNESQ